MINRIHACAAAALAATLAPTATAQQQLERVEITGSSIKRIEGETALPVQVIRREEIERSGVTSTEQLMQSITATSSMGGTMGSSGAGMSSYGLSTISLRGLDEERTLVLVNGRRVAPLATGSTSAVNLNAIPLAAIERIEILKDGASAVYGSDAIAGVVNFILVRDFSGVEVGATLGTPTRSGGGKNARAHVVTGFGDAEKDRYNLTLSLSVEKEMQLFGRDRGFARSAENRPFYLSGATGQGNIEGGYTPGTGVPTNPPSETGSPQPGFGGSPNNGYGNPLGLLNQCESIGMFRELQPPSDTRPRPSAPLCTYDPSPFVGLIPERESVNMSLNGVFRLGESAELFGDALLSRNVVTQTIQASPLRRGFLQSDLAFAEQGVDPVLLIRPGNPNYQIAADYLAAMEAQFPGQGWGALIGQPLAITTRNVELGNRTNESTQTQTRLVGGLRGQWLKQDYEIAAVLNRSKLSDKVTDGYFSQLAYARAVNDPANQWNPWSLTQTPQLTDAMQAAKYIGPTVEGESKTSALEGKLSGEVLNLPAGPLLYAAGGQTRKETYLFQPSPALLSGDIAGLGGAQGSIDKERKVKSVFGELSVPIVRALEGSVAVRGDDYDDVGSSSTYKAALRWQPVQQVLLRASLGTGFRAPTLPELHQPQTLGSTEQFNDPATGQNDIQVNSVSGGNPNLKPEKSRQRSIGIVLQPFANFTLAFDYFHIRVEDIIATPSTQEVVSQFRAGNPAFAGLATLTPTGEIESLIQTTQNVGDAVVKGIDVEAAFRTPLGPGRLDLGLSGTYMHKFDQTSPGGAVSHKVGTIRDENGNPVLGADENGIVLRWKHVLSATYTYGPWGFTFAQNFLKGYEDGLDLNGNPHGVPDQAFYDAQAAYTGIKNLKLAIGAKNVFDRDPALFIPVGSQFQTGYDVTTYDPRARFVYVSAAYRF